ncbi:hypothetical protein PR003_g18940 [Phytophthora rubi]|uniref:Uncharacterized protein n=1 Tax=Phytophthora rubi TaxID=129364 RepID=A0A6A3I7U6_9STRA|nr:hypothetical protein PR002_g25373 [Phytophthora rubi]KAE9315640.1 hypothetical protein PR003_g18940 [Phytophthora rubi]
MIQTFRTQLCLHLITSMLYCGEKVKFTRDIFRIDPYIM